MTNVEEQTRAEANGSFAGKVVFVTGAGSHIGRTIALAFAREGASVVVADVSERGNQETSCRIEYLSRTVLTVRCDMTQSEDVKAALDQTVEIFGASTSHSTMRVPNRSPTRLPILPRRSGTGSSRSTSWACSCA